MKKSIFIIAWSYLKRRKWQSLLVGICIALSALLFSTTLGLLQGMNRPFDMMYDQLKASHLLLMYDYREADTEQIQNWFKTQPEVVAVGNAMPFVSLESPIIYKNQELDLNVNLTERPLGQLDLDQVFFLQGKEAPYPKMGEIWLPDHLVQAHGMELGDTVGIPTPEGLYPLVVSASLVDPQYASGLFNPTRAWVAPGSLPFMFSINQLSQRMLGIRFEDPAKIQVVWQRFHQENYFTGKSLEYGLFKSVFLSFYQIIQMILLVFSLLGIIISLFILSTTLSGSIIGDLKLIGLYKATGFTPNNIIQIYLFQYLLLGIISLPLGLLGSYGLTRVILNQILHSVGLTNLHISFVNPMGITTLIFLALIGLIAWRGSRKAARINAVSAIRSDPSTSQNAISTPAKIWSINWLKVPVIWGMVMLLSNPRRTLYTGLSMVMAIFILLFSINVSHSFAGLKDQKAAWGLEDSDIQVKRNEKIALPLEHETMLDLLSQESAIDAVVPYAYVSAILPAMNQRAPQDILGKVYTSDLNAVGLFNLSGRHPASADEIALCVMTAQELQKQVGDSIHLFIEG
ncbi:MAG: FtsX-like permease family protein, partial [Bacteroidetes bacterium]|nr:FtsX-like permease family protein [Bacteroidota bacterium]